MMGLIELRAQKERILNQIILLKNQLITAPPYINTSVSSNQPSASSSTQLGLEVLDNPERNNEALTFEEEVVDALDRWNSQTNSKFPTGVTLESRAHQLCFHSNFTGCEMFSEIKKRSSHKAAFLQLKEPGNYNEEIQEIHTKILELSKEKLPNREVNYGLGAILIAIYYALDGGAGVEDLSEEIYSILLDSKILLYNVLSLRASTAGLAARFQLRDYGVKKLALVVNDCDSHRLRLELMSSFGGQCQKLLLDNLEIKAGLELKDQFDLPDSITLDKEVDSYQISFYRSGAGFNKPSNQLELKILNPFAQRIIDNLDGKYFGCLSEEIFDIALSTIRGNLINSSRASKDELFYHYEKVEDTRIVHRLMSSRSKNDCQREVTFNTSKDRERAMKKGQEVYDSNKFAEVKHNKLNAWLSILVYKLELIEKEIPLNYPDNCNHSIEEQSKYLHFCKSSTFQHPVKCGDFCDQKGLCNLHVYDPKATRADLHANLYPHKIDSLKGLKQSLILDLYRLGIKIPAIEFEGRIKKLFIDVADKKYEEYSFEVNRPELATTNADTTSNLAPLSFDCIYSSAHVAGQSPRHTNPINLAATSTFFNLIKGPDPPALLLTRQIGIALYQIVLSRGAESAVGTRMLEIIDAKSAFELEADRASRFFGLNLPTGSNFAQFAAGVHSVNHIISGMLDFPVEMPGSNHGLRLWKNEKGEIELDFHSDEICLLRNDYYSMERVVTYKPIPEKFKDTSIFTDAAQADVNLFVNHLQLTYGCEFDRTTGPFKIPIFISRSELSTMGRFPTAEELAGFLNYRCERFVKECNVNTGGSDVEINGQDRDFTPILLLCAMLKLYAVSIYEGHGGIRDAMNGVVLEWLIKGPNGGGVGHILLNKNMTGNQAFLTQRPTKSSDIILENLNFYLRTWPTANALRLFTRSTGTMPRISAFFINTIRSVAASITRGFFHLKEEDKKLVISELDRLLDDIICVADQYDRFEQPADAEDSHIYLDEEYD